MWQVNVALLSQCSLQNAQLSRNARELPERSGQPVVESYPPVGVVEVAGTGAVEAGAAGVVDVGAVDPAAVVAATPAPVPATGRAGSVTSM
jgi:hypothetical protein